MIKQALTHDQLSPGLKEMIDLFVTRTPLSIALTMYRDFPDLFLLLSFAQQEELIAEALKSSFGKEAARQLLQLRAENDIDKKILASRSNSQTEPASNRPVPDIVAFNAKFHPMCDVLFSLKTANSLFGLADEQLLMAADRLSDIATGPFDPGLDDADADFIEQIGAKIRALSNELSNLSEYYRAKAGMV